MPATTKKPAKKTPKPRNQIPHPATQITYGPWFSYTGTIQYPSIAYAMTNYLGDEAAHFNIPALVTEYAETVNTHLPDDVALADELITGPYPYNHDLTGAIRGAFLKTNTHLPAIAAKYDTRKKPAPRPHNQEKTHA